MDSFLIAESDSIVLVWRTIPAFYTFRVRESTWNPINPTQAPPK